MKSLKFKLMLTFILLIVASFSILSIFLYNYTKSTISNYIEASALEKMHEYASYVEMLQNQVYDSASLVYNSDRLKDWLMMQDKLSTEGDLMLEHIDLSKYLTQVTNSYTPIANLSIYYNNSLTISNEHYINKNSNYTKEAWYNNLINDARYWSPTSIDPIEQSRGNDELMMSMSMPIDSYQPDSASTFLKINVSQAYFFKPLERLHLGETGQFFLIDRYGQMLLTEQQQYLKPDQANYFEQITTTTSSEGKLYLTSKKNGERDMVVYYKLPKTKWIIVGIASEKDLFSELDRLRNTVLIIVSVLLIISILTAIFFTHSLSKPLSSLVSAMRHLRRGDFNQAMHRMKDERSSTLEIAFVIDMFKDMTHQLKEHISKQYQLTLLKQKAEYRALVMQINPHFLFNTLEMISSLALQNRGKETARIIASLGQMLRYALRGKDHLTPLVDEIKFIQHYLDIIKVRYGNEQDIQIIAKGELKRIHIVKFILQPLVENAVKFSTQKQHFIKIEIEILQRDAVLIIIVRDIGPGFSDDAIFTLRQHIGNHLKLEQLDHSEEKIGLKNVLLRCYSIYGKAFSYSIAKSKFGGAELTLTIPVREEASDD